MKSRLKSSSFLASALALICLFALSSGQQVSHEANSNNRTKNATTTTTTVNKQPAETPKRQQAGEDEYLIGVGIGDITGPAADINLVSLLRQLLELAIGGGADSSLFAGSSQSAPSTGTSILNDLMRVQHPSWRELTNVKLQLKINMNSLLLQLNSAAAAAGGGGELMETLIRWAMPNRIKMQAEYTYANLVVQL